MSYAAKVVAHSLQSDASGAPVPLVTFEVTFPRFILAEFNTHRALSRNSASSRAIPVERRADQVEASPFVPEAFTKNKRGMQADATLEDAHAKTARRSWIGAAMSAVVFARRLAGIEVHKQHANRVMEPYAWHTVIATGTEWANFFALRDHMAAQPEMQITAKLMREAYETSEPRMLRPGEWHLPYVTGVERALAAQSAVSHEGLIQELLSISVTKCAAVSFERQATARTPEQCAERHDSLRKSGHWSPFEHQAQAVDPMAAALPPFGPRYRFVRKRDGSVVHAGGRGEWQIEGWFCGNLRAPWLQYRKMLPGEAVFQG